MEPLLLQNQLCSAGSAHPLSLPSSLMANLVRFSFVPGQPSAPTPSLSWAGTVMGPFQRPFGCLELTSFIFCLFSLAALSLFLLTDGSHLWHCWVLQRLWELFLSLPSAPMLYIFYVPVWKKLMLSNFIFWFSDWEHYQIWNTITFLLKVYPFLFSMTAAYKITLKSWQKAQQCRKKKKKEKQMVTLEHWFCAAS